MLDRAHVLPDGRRVFETEDGQRVIDENGQEVSPDVITPEEIADSRPRAETYLEAWAEEQRLLSERDELIDYQREVDAARERLDDGTLTAQELQDLEATLEANMPAVLRETASTPGPAAPDQPSQPETAADHDATGRAANVPPFQPR